MEISVQDYRVIATIEEATGVSGDIEAWAASYLDSGMVTDDYTTYAAAQCSLLDGRHSDAPHPMDASEA